MPRSSRSTARRAQTLRSESAEMHGANVVVVHRVFRPDATLQIREVGIVGDTDRVRARAAANRLSGAVAEAAPGISRELGASRWPVLSPVWPSGEVEARNPRCWQAIREDGTVAQAAGNLLPDDPRCQSDSSRARR